MSLVLSRILMVFLSLLVIGSCWAGQGNEPRVKVTVLPGRPFVEHRGAQQLLNFDLVLDNVGSVPLHLIAVRLAIFDEQAKVIMAKELDENGQPAGITTIARRDLPVGAAIDVFNPFYYFGPEVKLYRLHYEFFFVREGNPGPPIPFAWDYKLAQDVFPIEYPGNTNLILPIKQRVIVYDGHDFYSHHRRQDLSDPEKRRKGAKNFNLYAYDFMVVGEHGEVYRGSPFKKENWFSYGVEIYAPGSGIVVQAVDDIPENTYEGGHVVYAKDLNRLDPNGIGNHVIIDHGNGEYSYLLHMRPGSVHVKKGDKVKRGQLIGQIGFSGDSLGPHLHYTLVDSPHYPGQGLPSYFRDFRRILGSHSEDVRRGAIDTGDIVESLR
jgi:peptidase M23-like protein